MTIPKNNQVIVFIVISFIVGALAGYAIHTPETKIEYINKTIEVPKIIYEEKIVEVTVTATPTGTTPAPTPQIPTISTSNFSMKVYDPSTDKTDKIIEFNNNRASPPGSSVRPGKSVLFKNIDYTVSRPLALVVDSSNEIKLSGGSGVFVTYYEKGTYEFKAVYTSKDPNVKPTIYAKGTITVY